MFDTYKDGVREVKDDISKESIEIAAQCWCDEETSMIEMDTRLATAFAKRLDVKKKEVDRLKAALGEARGELQSMYELVCMQEIEVPDREYHRVTKTTAVIEYLDNLLGV